MPDTLSFGDLDILTRISAVLLGVLCETALSSLTRLG
jgi:hypothetical protein